MQIEAFTNDDVFNFNGEFKIDDLSGNLIQPALINNENPYSDDALYRTILKKPIIVTSNYPTFKYEDVAIVEPGDAGGIYDYVTIEGSTDLINWTQLDIYDCERFIAWIEEYDKGATATITENLFREQQIRLLDTYNEGEKIVLRFSLVTDPFVNSFGWAIKSINRGVNLSIEEEKTLNNSIQIYPTLVSNSIQIISNTEVDKASIEIFNLSGQKVSQKKVTINSTPESIDLNGLSQGIYFVRIKQGNTVIKSEKIVKK